MIASILATYGIDHKYSLVEPISGGLINMTWKVTCGQETYILQRVNHNVFKKPIELGKNIRLLHEYIQANYPGYLFVAPIKNKLGEDIVCENGYYRLFPFVKNSRTIDVVTSADQAYEAALQFGRFTHRLSGFDSSLLSVTIPDFHNLSYRYKQFADALNHRNPHRIRECKDLIDGVKERISILSEFEKIIKNPSVKLRVTHHDTKISNVLFDDQGRGMCVIDLDTVMPGYFISDVGDMIRTYLSPVSEEENDFEKIEVREDYFKAIVQGYLTDMDQNMTKDEQQLIFYSGLFMIYMQVIRFLADYLNNDSYYGSQYEGHNLVRATNQMVLLKRLQEKEKIFNAIIAKEIKTISLSKV